MKRKIGILSVICSVLLISYSIFGWVWASYDFNWTLTEIYSNGNTTSTTGGTAIAEDSSGVTHIASMDNETGGSDNQSGLVYSRYVGSGGNCDNVTDSGGNSDGSDAWNCRVIDANGQGGDATVRQVDMAIASDVVYIAYTDGSDIYLATCNDSSDDCDTTGSWTTTNIADDGTTLSIDAVSSSLIGIAYTDDVTNELVTARYVASGGNCDDSFGGASDNYDCEIIDTTDTIGDNPEFIFGQQNMYHTFYAVTGGGSHCTKASTTCYVHAVRETSGPGNASDDADWELYPSLSTRDIMGISAARGVPTPLAALHEVQQIPSGENPESIITAFTTSANIVYTSGCASTYCYGSYPDYEGDVGIELNGDIPSIADTETGGDAKIFFGDTSTNLGKTYMAEWVDDESGNCTNPDFKCYEAVNTAGAYNHGHTSVHLSDPFTSLGTGGGLFGLEGEEEPEPTVPEFTSKLAAVIIGASALGLFGLIVLFRGRKKKAK